MCWLALQFPRLPLEVAGVDAATPDLPCAVLHEGGRRILMVNASSAGQGVRPGQSPTAARVLVPALRLLPRDRQRESQVLQTLAAWALQFSAQVSLAPPDALLVEVAGSRRLFGGWAGLMSAVRRAVDAIAHQTSMAAAPSPGGALLLARAGLQRRVPDIGRLRDCLAAVPLSGMPLPEAHLAGLQGAGLRSCGDLLALPRAEIGRRLGVDFLDWWARLLGEAPDPLGLFEPPAAFESVLELPFRVETVEGLAFPARRLLSLLEGFLRGRQAVVQRLLWRLGHEDLPDTRLVQGLQSPGRDAGQLLSLLREQLTRLSLVAPVQRLGLQADELSSWAGEAGCLMGDGAAERDPAFLDRLRARLGAAAVSGLCLVEDHRPEHSMRTCPPGAGGIAIAFPERPMWLLSAPRPLELRDGLPWWQGPLRLEGERERISAGWWAGRPVRRDYFVAQAPTGTRLWIFRDAAGGKGWFLHGFFG